MTVTIESWSESYSDHTPSTYQAIVDHYPNQIARISSQHHDDAYRAYAVLSDDTVLITTGYIFSSADAAESELEKLCENITTAYDNGFLDI
jgi:hypothetical protein